MAEQNKNTKPSEDKKNTGLAQPAKKAGKDKSHFISRGEGRRISRENVRITKGYEKRKKRKNVPESEYLSKMKDPKNIVEFENLNTYFFTDSGVVKAVNGVTFSIPQGSTVGVVGESGCGKSVTSLSLMQLVQAPQGQVIDGSEIRFKSSVYKEKNGKKIPVWEYETDASGNKTIKQRPVLEKNGKRIPIWEYETDESGNVKQRRVLDESGIPVKKDGQPVIENIIKQRPVLGKDGKQIIKNGKPVFENVQAVDEKGAPLFENCKQVVRNGKPLFENVQATDKFGALLFETEEKVFNVAKMPYEEMRKIRGREISMIFQEPMTSLNPVFRIGNQLDEVVMLHLHGATKEIAKAKTYEMLKLVGIIPENVYRRYPHELSGGMRQRVIIAMSLICNPKLIIADEPTTALDVTIQAQILELLRDVKDKISGSIMLITHDLGVIAEMADFVVVMYAGRIIEMGTAKDVFDNPMHPYTVGLQKSKPAVNKKVDKLYSIPGSVPNPINMPKHCYFKGRCDRRFGTCDGEYPCMHDISETHKVACHLYDNIKEGNK